jgi:hypothetical protein
MGKRRFSCQKQAILSKVVAEKLCSVALAERHAYVIDRFNCFAGGGCQSKLSSRIANHVSLHFPYDQKQQWTYYS